MTPAKSIGDHILVKLCGFHPGSKLSLVQRKVLFSWSYMLGISMMATIVMTYIVISFPLLESSGTFSSASTEDKVVALTFDDGPNAKYTPAILDILSEKGVSATFFMVGKSVE